MILRNNKFGSECLTWVISRHFAEFVGCSLYPRNRTSPERIEMSPSGQNQKSSLPRRVSTLSPVTEIAASRSMSRIASVPLVTIVTGVR